MCVSFSSCAFVCVFELELWIVFYWIICLKRVFRYMFVTSPPLAKELQSPNYAFPGPSDQQIGVQ